jgi:hypothetical protein
LTLRQAQELGRVQMTMVPGSDIMVNGVYYLKPNESRLKEIVTTFLNGSAESASALGGLVVKPPTDYQ